jgi:glycosyltransferase involved in cell wall biosynthesis
MQQGISVITWQRHGGRAEELSAALGGRTCHVHPSALTGGTLRTLLRYVVSSLMSVAHLARHRPVAVIVTNPPVVPGLLVLCYALLTGRRYVLDSHPVAFGAKDHALARRLLPVHRLLARRAAAVMVTTEQWVETVNSWGGRGLVVHEAPPGWSVGDRKPAERPHILFVGVFGSDEPVDMVFEAARRMPDVDFSVTGDLRRCPAELLGSAPSNLRLTGFLGPEDYRAALEAADVVLVLTTEPTSVVRAGYEAVYARRALVVTGTPVLRQVFPSAFHTENEPSSIVSAVRSALAAADETARLDDAWSIQMTRWDQQLASLQAAFESPQGI